MLRDETLSPHLFIVIIADADRQSIHCRQLTSTLRGFGKRLAA